MKVYVGGSDPSIRVPRRAITLTDGTVHTVYDTSGPYTDSDATLEIRRGLAAIARAVDSCTQRHGRARAANLALPSRSRRDARARRGALSRAAPRPARQTRRQRLPDALRPSRRDHAGDGVRRGARERRNGVRARGAGTRTRDSAVKRQPSRERADDHRP